MKYRGVAVFGLNGAGKSTITHALAKELGYLEADVEDYYYPAQKLSRQMAMEHRIPDRTETLPFSVSRTKDEVEREILRDIGCYPGFILCGVSMSWSEELLSRIDIAFWLQAPLEERMNRIQNRERIRFGARVLPGGDLYASQRAFREMAAGRDPASLEESAVRLHCSVYRLDGMLPIETNIQQILNILKQ